MKAPQESGSTSQGKAGQDSMPAGQQYNHLSDWLKNEPAKPGKGHLKPLCASPAVEEQPLTESAGPLIPDERSSPAGGPPPENTCADGQDAEIAEGLQARQSAEACNGSQSVVDPEVFASLPPDIRRELKLASMMRLGNDKAKPQPKQSAVRQPALVGSKHKKPSIANYFSAKQ